jgi:two-component system, NtrC family, nitrogen regulation sensor histidine kinase GlnL
MDDLDAAFAGLEFLGSAVVALDDELAVCYANPAAEHLFDASRRNLTGQRLPELFVEAGELVDVLERGLADDWEYAGRNLSLTRPQHDTLQLNCMVMPLQAVAARLLVEFRQIDEQLKSDREEQLLGQQRVNRELIRNLAHEIKNPLGGIRGSAQLLERELERPNLREYTQVIIKETDRLQQLMDRLLTPSRLPHYAPINVHEALERVRSLILAEYPEGIEIVRDYDTSLPEIAGDREQLIQAVLNVVRNAAQALNGHGNITLRTRAARQVTLAKRRVRLALVIEIIDNGPGVPEELLDRIFYPLVSGREHGSGLGLTLAQTFIEQHHGTIACDSRPGRTCFTIVLPVQ